jgi:hypothetical protein
VGGVGVLGCSHIVGVAVIGGHECVSARTSDGPEESVELRIDRLDGFDRGVEVARVTDHIRIGVVEN